MMSKKCCFITKKHQRCKKKSKHIIDCGLNVCSTHFKFKHDVCPICLDFIKNKMILDCNHIFCKKCISKWMDKNDFCPVCKQHMTINYNFEIYLIHNNTENAIQFNSSSDCLIDQLFYNIDQFQDIECDINGYNKKYNFKNTILVITINNKSKKYNIVNFNPSFLNHLNKLSLIEICLTFRKLILSIVI